MRAAERADPVLPAGLAHGPGAAVAGRVQLTRRRHADIGRDARAQQGGQHEQLVQRARAVGENDAGFLGVAVPVPVKQLLDDELVSFPHGRAAGCYRSGGGADTPDSADRSSRSRARSPMETTPTGTPSRTTGMRRTARSRTKAAARSTSSSGPSMTSSVLQMSPIRVVSGSRPSASTRMVMSRSVRSPLSRPSASTSTLPIPCRFMALAAADTDSVAAMQIGAGDMMSRTFVATLHLQR